MKKNKLKLFVFDQKFESTALTIIIGITFGILTVSYILWARVFRQVFPREIVGNIFSIKFLVIVTLFTYFSLILVLSLRKSYKLFFGLPLEIKNKFILNFIETFPQKFPKLNERLLFISNYILDAPLFLWRYLYINGYLYSNNSIILKSLYAISYYFFLIPCFHYFDDKKTDNIIISVWTILLIYLPRIIMCTILLFEIYFKKQIIIFYSYGIILLIPLIFLAYRRMLFEMAMFEIERLEDEYICIEYQGDVRCCTNKDPQCSKEEFMLALQSYISMHDLKNRMQQFFDFGDKYDTFVLSIIFALLTITFFIWLQKFN